MDAIKIVIGHDEKGIWTTTATTAYGGVASVHSKEFRHAISVAEEMARKAKENDSTEETVGPVITVQSFEATETSKRLYPENGTSK